MPALPSAATDLEMQPGAPRKWPPTSTASLYGCNVGGLSPSIPSFPASSLPSPPRTLAAKAGRLLHASHGRRRPGAVERLRLRPIEPQRMNLPAGAAQIRIPNIEIRSKSESRRRQCSKHGAGGKRRGHFTINRFEFSPFGGSNLFRVSGFEFRIYVHRTTAGGVQVPSRIEGGAFLGE